MRIVLDCHIVFDPDANSAWSSSVVFVMFTGEDGELHTEPRHQIQRELLWESGKAVSISCDFHKALGRFEEVADLYVTDF